MNTSLPVKCSVSLTQVRFKSSTSISPKIGIKCSIRMKVKVAYNKMKGVVYTGDKQAEVKDFPMPKPKGRQILVKVKATTICGSDMQKWRSSKEDLLKRFGKGGMEKFWFNLIQGHEGAGVVEDIGPSVDLLKKGDRVMMVHFQGCGVCRKCIEGNPRLCTTIDPDAPAVPTPSGEVRMGQWLQATNVNGTFAEYVLNRNECSVRKLDPFLSYVDGAIMGCAGGTAFASLRKTSANARTKMIIYGLGPVGLCDVVIAKALGAYVIGVDVHEERVKLGEKHGCDLVINSKEEDPVKKIMGLTNNEGLDVAIEASGFALISAVQSVSKDHGIVCVTGFGDDSKGVLGFNTQLLWERGVWGSSLFPLQSVHELMDILVQHKVHLDEIVDTTYNLSQAQEAHEQFETYKSGKISFRL